MDFSKLFGVVGILRETVKVLARTKHAMIIIATISILLNFLLLFSNVFSTKPVLADLFGKGTSIALSSPQGPEFINLLLEVKQDIWFIWAMTLAILSVSFLVSLFIMMAIILGVSTGYKGKSISFDELLHRLATSCFKPLITLLHIKMYSMGYAVFSLALLVVVMFSVNTIAALKAFSIAVGTVAVLLWIYLYIVWMMGMVVCVIEENCYGMEALGKASKLVKGKRLDGYVLNFIAILGSAIIYRCSRKFMIAESVPSQMFWGFLMSVFSGVMQIFLYSTYTVFYCQCKGTHGEELELNGSLEYSKVPSSYIPPLSGEIP